MSRHITFLSAILIPTACLPRPPEFAPEELTTRLTTEASVLEVGQAAQQALRELGFAVRVEEEGYERTKVRGEQFKGRLPEDHIATGGKNMTGTSKDATSVSIIAVDHGWSYTTTFDVTAVRVADETQVTIVPGKKNAEGPVPLSMREVRFTQRLTESIQKALAPGHDRLGKKE